MVSDVKLGSQEKQAIPGLFVVTLIATLMLFAPAQSLAQVSYGGGSAGARSAGPLVSMVDFSFDSDIAPDRSFQFDGTAYGAFYGREGFSFRLLRGQSDIGGGEELVLIDGTLAAYGAWRPIPSDRERQVDVYVPVGIQSDYRKVSRRGGEIDTDVFEVTTLALGAGAGITLPVSSTDLAIRSMPFFGIASQSFGQDAGTAAGLTIDVEWATSPIRGRYGLYAGWGYRWQRWLLDAGSIFIRSEDLPNVPDNIEYRGSSHTFQIGITF